MFEFSSSPELISCNLNMLFAHFQRSTGSAKTLHWGGGNIGAGGDLPPPPVYMSKKAQNECMEYWKRGGSRVTRYQLRIGQINLHSANTAEHSPILVPHRDHGISLDDMCARMHGRCRGCM